MMSEDRSPKPEACSLVIPHVHDPLAWTIQHWIGIVHAAARTVLVVAAWYLFPGHRFVVIPVVIACIYAVTIVVLERRLMADP